MEAEKTRLPKALSPLDVLRKKYDTLPLEGAWQEALGKPESRGVWFIWGSSGSGKTSFAMQLAKELTKYGKVAYNSLEQGSSLSVAEAFKRHDFLSIERGRFILLKESIATLSERLSKRKSPDIVIIDSLQYTRLNYKTYIAFKEAHPDKLIIFVSHAKGVNPRGETAVSIQYDAEMKIYCEGYRATCKGRFNSETGAAYVIWEEGAARYTLQSDNKTNKKTKE